MATKSFLKNIVIKSKKSAERFLSALEKAEKKEPKNVKIEVPVEDVKDNEVIKKIFKNVEGE